MNLLVPFITGLTTGGLSCLAIQGGLLASSLARQLEVDLQTASGRPVAKARRALAQKQQPRIALPIAAFLAAKLLAYTLLGALLGALGSLFQLTPLMRAALMLAIGLFMLGNALRMLNVHPIFRYFVFEPPSAVTRYIRRLSKNGETLVTPAVLGAMTVLIPCGVTQAMMAVALSSGNALQGAAILFAFTLGATPVFFSVSYFATRLGATLEKNFTRVAAIVVLALGLLSIDSGLNLAGSPVSFTKAFSEMLVAAAPAQDLAPTAPPAATGAASADTYVVNVGNSGYSPSVLHLAANKPVTINWITSNTSSCARAVVIPNLNYQEILPATGQVATNIPPQPKNTIMPYSCSMGMYFGKLIFDLN